MKKIFYVTSKILIALSLMAMPLVPVSVYAQKADVCEGVGLTTGTNGCDQPPGGVTVEGAIHTAVNLISLFVGVAAVIMIIVGGVKYITSSGDSANVNSAKNTILYAIIGLVIVLLAQVIVRFVINRVNP